ncbi:MAG: copper transporter [Bacillota bacterium]
MIINLKYYVITIVAIFLALGVGIFIGIMLDGQELIMEQQQQLVNQLQSKFDEFKSKQDELQNRIDQLMNERDKNIKMVEKIYPEAIKGKLTDTNVVVIETSEEYAYPGITDTLQKANAANVTNILIKTSFLLEDEDIAMQIAKDLNLSGNTKDEIEKQLIKEFCSGIVNGDKIQLMQYLKDNKMIDYQGILNLPADYVVIAGGSIEESKEQLNRIETPLINFVKNSNIPIMAVEKLSVVQSNINEYKKLRISTVDNVDTMIGKASMLMVISGREGHFGEKPTAESLMPEGFVVVE